MSGALAPLLRPRRIAVIGASDRGTPADVIGNLDRSGFAGEVFPVNPNRSTVLGRPCWPDLPSVGEPVDVAAITVRAARAPGALRDCIAAGARAAVIFADGFSVRDPDGPRLQQEVGDLAAAAGIPVLGPNCMGYLAPAYGTAVYIDRIHAMPASGAIGLVTQSGSVGVAGINHTGTFALSAMISVGNEAGVDIADAVDWLAGDGVTRSIAIFAEGIRDGRRFLAAADRALANGIPVVMCKSGRSRLGHVAAVTHTGAMANDQRVLVAALEAHGIAVVRDLDELFAAAELLATGRRFGPRLAGATLSGGHVGLLHDLAEDAGVHFPPPEPALRERLVTIVGQAAPAGNPVDAWVNDDVPAGVREAMLTLAGSPAVDGFVYLVDTPRDPPTSYTGYGHRIAQAAADLAGGDERPVAMVSSVAAADDPAVLETLRRSGVPRLPSVRAALFAWSAISRAQAVHALQPAETCHRTVGIMAGMTEPVLYSLLGDAGFDVPRHALCRDPASARNAAETIGYPVVLKVVSAAIAHKSDVDGVVLPVTDALSAERAAARLLALDGAEGVLVAEMIGEGVDVIAGLHNDPAFGPFVVFGAGGILAELLDDVAVLPAPTTEAAVRQALKSLRLERLLRGYRNQAAVGIERLAHTVVRLSRLRPADPGISLDLNPVRLTGERAVILDALASGRLHAAGRAA